MGEVFICSLFFGTLLFFFPIFVHIDAYVDAAENRCWFSLSLFKVLKFFGGYLQLKKEGLVFHVSEKKAILLPYKELAPMRKKFEITKGFQLFRFHQIFETGGEGRPSGVAIATVLTSLSAQIFSVLKTLHPFLSLKTGLLLNEERAYKLTLHAVFIFNGFVLTIAIGKKILEAIIQWIRKKRSTASWKKQLSN